MTQHTFEVIESSAGFADSSHVVRRSDAVPEIAVFGEWSPGNLGDRTVYAAMRHFFEDCGWRVRAFHLGSLSPVGEDGALPGDSPAGRSSRAGALDAHPPVKRSMRGIWHRVRVLRLLPRLERAQAIAVGGGELLSDDHLRFPQSLLELSRYARALDKPLLCLGCSAEGAWSARGWRMIREFLEACSVLAVRDSGTATRVAATLGVAPPVFGDFSLREVPSAGDYPARRPHLAINVSQLSGRWAAYQKQLEDALVTVGRAAAARMASRGIGIRVFTTATEDAPAASRVHARLEASGSRLYLPASPDELVMLLRTACAVVATRLHGAVLPLASSVPVVGLGVSPRLAEFFSTMNLGRYCYEADATTQLADWLALVDLEVALGDQGRAIAHSAVWKTRAEVRARVASFAGGPLPLQ